MTDVRFSTNLTAPEGDFVMKNQHFKLRIELHF
jgi:hypothetical protein